MTEEGGLIGFQRFTQEQLDFYESVNENSYKAALTSAGVRIKFRTNSTKIKISGIVKNLPKQNYYAFDIMSDGELVASWYKKDSICGIESTFSFQTQISDGMKDITIHLPYSVQTYLSSIELDDGSTVSPIKQTRRLFMFGDSITHGFYAESPSKTYASRVADALDAELINKGVSGEIFRSEFADLTDETVPELITVAYGTNDRCKTDQVTFEANCREFLEKLSRNYLSSQVFVLTPIWRADHRHKAMGYSFEHVEDYITEVCSELENVTVLRGFDYVPHDASYFADGSLHPNDMGFEHYANSLINIMKEKI